MAARLAVESAWIWSVVSALAWLLVLETCQISVLYATRNRPSSKKPASEPMSRGSWGCSACDGDAVSSSAVTAAAAASLRNMEHLFLWRAACVTAATL